MSSSKDVLCVEVECCTDCHLHSWCSRHEEAKYTDHFSRLESKLAAALPDVKVVKNPVPGLYRRVSGKSAAG